MLRKTVAFGTTLVLCGGCFERLIGMYVKEADISTGRAGDVATIEVPGLGAAECWATSSFTGAQRLIVDPGYVEVSVTCKGFGSTYPTTQDFQFVADPGHDYKIEYGISPICMKLRDVTSDLIVADHC